MSPRTIRPESIDAILFDMDGTLIETDDVDVSKWRQRFDRIMPGDKDNHLAARRFVMALETPVNAVFSLLDLVGLDTPFIRLMITLQGSHTSPADSIPAIPGVEAVLPFLAEHYRIGVVSTRTQAESNLFLDALGLSEYVEVIAGRDTTWRIKPHPQPVLYAAGKLGVPPQRCLMVGDTTVDITAGRRAGAWTCGVLCGYGQRAELERVGADMILDSTAQVHQALSGE